MQANKSECGFEGYKPIKANVYSGDKAGILISAQYNGNSLWNQEKSCMIKFLTWGSSGGQANGGATGVTVQGGSTEPSFVLSMGPYGKALYQIFTVNETSAYGKRMYLYPDYTNPNLPDETPVTIGYLKEKSIITTATYTSAPGAPNNDGDATTILTQTNVSIPSQCEFDGRTTTGRGFTLQGSTTDQPTNTSAICLQMYHPITAAAQLLYTGDTTSDDTCLQTKASTLSLVRGTGNTFTKTNNFHGPVTIGTSSTGQLVDVFNVLRVRANSNNDLSGFNNGAIYVNDKTGATVAGMYDDGLYTTKKVVFNSTSSTQDILLEGADNKGLNIKVMSSSTSQIFATLKPSGSIIKSSLDLNLNKLTNLANPTTGYDGANKSYVDTEITNNVPSIGTWYNFSLNGNNGSSALDSFFGVYYKVDSWGRVNLIVNAVNSTNIMVGTKICTLPAGYRPGMNCWHVFEMINSDMNVTAKVVVKNNGDVMVVEVSGGSDRMYGNTIFDIYDPQS